MSDEEMYEEDFEEVPHSNELSTKKVKNEDEERPKEVIVLSLQSHSLPNDHDEKQADRKQVDEAYASVKMPSPTKSENEDSPGAPAKDNENREHTSRLASEGEHSETEKKTGAQQQNAPVAVSNKQVQSQSKATKHSMGAFSLTALSQQHQLDASTEDATRRRGKLPPVGAPHFHMRTKEHSVYNKHILSHSEKEEIEIAQLREEQAVLDKKVRKDVKIIKKAFREQVEAEKRKLEEKLRTLGHLPHTDKDGRLDLLHSPPKKKNGSEEQDDSSSSALNEDHIIHAAQSLPPVESPYRMPPRRAATTVSPSNQQKKMKVRGPAALASLRTSSHGPSSSGYCLLGILDGAVSDFMFGGEIRKSRIPEKYLKERRMKPKPFR